MAGDEAGRDTVLVDTAKIASETQCAICMEVIKKCKTIPTCMHRFCTECIESSLRLAKPECPFCRVAIGNRRVVKPDPAYDQLIEALYGNVEEYERKREEQMMAFLRKRKLEQTAQMEQAQDHLKRQELAARED
ncbi:unnamed protein product [Pedinophyceae sp. YPF-701]|nr:unnamed protein product [Pedinophyceae sp. YPF-701]